MDSCLPLIAYVKTHLHKQRKPRSHWASRASVKIGDKVQGACLRMQWYEWMEVPWTNPADENAGFRFAMGNLIEDWYEEGLKILGVPYVRGEKFKLYPKGLKNHVTCKLDFRVDNKGEWEIIEVKSSFGRGMGLYKKEQLPKDIHSMQMLCYLSVPELGCVIANNPIFARDNFYRLSFRVSLTEDGKLWCNGRILPYTFEGIVERWRELEAYIDKKELPPRDYDNQKRYPCMYCNFRNKCWETIVV